MALASGGRTPLTNDLIWIESVARLRVSVHALGMRLIRIDHVSLDVRDRPDSIAWYEEVLGLRPHARHDVPGEPVFLGPAGARFGLFAERPPSLRHIALTTDAADQRRLAARLDRLGIPYAPERDRDSDSISFAADADRTARQHRRRPRRAARDARRADPRRHEALL
jgi:catechol 2,3-dioxygenase-like lactoylglutathione lyase family enzyme